MACRDLEDVKKAIVSAMNRAKFEKELWEKVEICKKKDGTDFAVISKSFKNASYEVAGYRDAFHPEIVVRGRNNANGGSWEEYSLFAFIYTDSLADDDERKSKEVKEASFMRGTYLLSPDEIKNVIFTRIVNLSSIIREYEKELEIADKAYCKFIDAVVDAIEELERDTECVRSDDNWSHSTLEYKIIEVLDSAGSSKLSWKRNN